MTALDRAAQAMKAKSDEWDFRGSLSNMRPRNLSEQECRSLLDIALAEIVKEGAHPV